MKKAGLLLFALLLGLFCPLASSAGMPIFSTQSEEFQLGETLLANITGTFVNPIKLSDITIWQGRDQVSLESDLILYNGTYYYYAYLTRAGNFTLRIPNILYHDPQLKSATIEKQILVRAPTADSEILGIRPGFVLTSGAASIIISNKGALSLEAEYLDTVVPLLPGQFENISITPEEPFSFLEIKTYNDFFVPIIHTELGGPVQVAEGSLSVSPNLVQVKVIAGSDLVQPLLLTNRGNNSISLRMSTDLPGIALSDIEEIPPQSTSEVNLTMSGAERGFLVGNLTIDYIENGAEFSEIVPLEIYIFPQNATENETTVIENKSTCLELGGKVCAICNGQSVYAADGWCCFGTCSETQAEEPIAGGYGWIIGVVIFAVLGVVGYLIYKRAKRTKPLSPKESLAKESKLYEHRVSGALSEE